MVTETEAEKIARARKLIADQGAELEAAIAVFRTDRLAVCHLRGALKMLRRVKVWARDPDGVVTLALGFLGPNGWEPYIASLTREADRLAKGGA